MHGGLRKKAKMYKTFAFPEIRRSGDFKAYIALKYLLSNISSVVESLPS